MDKKSIGKIGLLLDTNEDNWNFYVSEAYLDFIANSDVADKLEIFKAGAEWFKAIVKRNIERENVR